MKHPVRVALSASLIVLGLSVVIPSVAQAQAGGANFSMPPGVDAGAVMSRDLRNFQWQRQYPFLFQMVTQQDVTGPPQNQKPEIIFEEGVIPQNRGIQGMIVTPGGQVYIGPPTE